MSKDSALRTTALVQALNLIPYFQAHPGRTIMEASRDLGRTPKEIRDDLARLTCSGVGSWPEELIDIQASYREVEITNSQGLDRALRLTPTEASALLLTLESMENVPGLVADRSAIESAARKLRSILDPKTIAVVDSVSEDDAEESEMLQTINQAISQQQRLRITYYSLSSQKTSTRIIDPYRVFIHRGESYVQATEPTREHALGEDKIKNFRVDRIRSVEVTDERAEPATSPKIRALLNDFDSQDPFDFNRALNRVHLLIQPEATWLADYYPITVRRGEKDRRADGLVPATMPLNSREWLTRFLISHGDRVQLVGPQAIVEAVSARAQDALAIYDG